MPPFWTVRGIPLPQRKATLASYTITAGVTITGTSAAIARVQMSAVTTTVTPGDTIEISGAAQTGYNSQFTVAAMTAAGNFQIAIGGAGQWTASETGGAAIVNQVLSLPALYNFTGDRTVTTISNGGYTQKAGKCLVTVAGKDLRWSNGGTKPSLNQSVGSVITDGSNIDLDGELQISTSWFVAKTGGGTATLQIHPDIPDNR